MAKRLLSSFFGWSLSDDETSSFKIMKIRPPRTPDASGPSLNCLGTDVIIMVLQRLADTSPESLNDVALVSSYYRHWARYCQHCTVTLNVSENGKDLGQRLEYMKKSGFLPAIREIRVVGNGRWHQDSKPITLAADLVRKCTGLTDLHWFLDSNTNESTMSQGVPHSVLSALRDPARLHAQVRLHTAINCGSLLQETKATFVAMIPLLEETANLHSLALCFSYRYMKEAHEVIKAAKRVLLSCPNLRKLVLDIGKWQRGCVMYAEAPGNYGGFGFVRGQCPPALEELDMTRYPFGYECEKPSWASEESFFYYPEKGNEVEYWAQYFDWSRLKRLRTGDLKFAVAIAPKLSALEHVDFIGQPEWSGQDDSGMMHSFFENVPGFIQSISVPNLALIGQEQIIRHGVYLKSLQIHQHNAKDWAAQTIDPATLLAIREHCCDIEDLTIDVARDGEWPTLVLDIIALFPKLRRLTLFFQILEIGEDFSPFNEDLGGTRALEPYLTFSGVQAILTHILNRRPADMTPIQQLEVAASTHPQGHGRLTFYSMWIRLHTMRFLCKPLGQQSDVDPERVAYVTTCPEATEEARELATKNNGTPSSSSEDFSGDDSSTGPFPVKAKIAHDGPIMGELQKADASRFTPRQQWYWRRL